MCEKKTIFREERTTFVTAAQLVYIDFHNYLQFLKLTYRKLQEMNT
jgi:hypothetical protein